MKCVPLPLFDRIQVAASNALPYVLLAGLAVGLYFPSLGGGFVCDSRLQILTDSFIHDPSHWLDVLTLRVMGMDVLDFNRPVQIASLMADAALWGRDPFGYRLTDVLQHALNGCLLFSVLRRLPEQGGSHESRGCRVAVPAMLATALFLVHPLGAEVVCEPSNREDLLVTTFVLCALLSAMRLTETGRAWLVVAGTSAFTFLALGSKETGVAAPVLVVAYLLLFPGKSSRRQRILLAAIPCLVTALFLAVRFFAQPAESVIFTSQPGYPGGSMAAAMAIQPRIFALYLTNVFHPTNLCADYGLYSVRNLPLSLSLLILGPAAAGLAAGCWKDRRILLATTGILAALLPVSNIVPIYCPAADRFLYLPLALGTIIPLCLLETVVIRRHIFLQIPILMIAATAIFSLAGTNRKMQTVWRDAGALWSSCVERNPFSITARVGLADALLRDRKWAEAKKNYLLAMEMPGGRSFPDVWSGLALCDDADGDSDGACAAAAEAVRLDPFLLSEGKILSGLRGEAEFAREFSAIVSRCYPVSTSE
jgi:hypothetical protein